MRWTRARSARTCAPCRRPRSSPRPRSRWCSPTPTSRSSAADSMDDIAAAVDGVRAPDRAVTLLRRHVLLVGFMGSGKSTVGRALADRLGTAFIDLDERMALDAGRSIPQIFAEEGETGFRDRESAALSALAAEPPAVVACGGGIVTGREPPAAYAAGHRRLPGSRPCRGIAPLRRRGRAAASRQTRRRRRSRCCWLLASLRTRRSRMFASAPTGSPPTKWSIEWRTHDAYRRPPRASRQRGERVNLVVIPVDVPGSPYEVILGNGLMRELGAQDQDVAEGEEGRAHHRYERRGRPTASRSRRSCFGQGSRSRGSPSPRASRPRRGRSPASCSKPSQRRASIVAMPWSPSAAGSCRTSAGSSRRSTCAASTS